MFKDDTNDTMAAPYYAAGDREERFSELREQKENAIWESFEDELEGAEFIRDNMSDPDKLLADVLQAVACAKATLWKVRGNQPAAVAAQGVVLKDLYDKLVMKIDEHVEPEAGYQAERDL